MALCAYYRLHLMVGCEIKKTLNAGRRGNFTWNGTGLAMLDLSNGETDALFFQCTLNQKNRCMKHIMVKEKGIQVIQMS